MSRYAFNDYVSDLLSAHEGIYSPATLARERRRYTRMFRDLLVLFNAGKISTLSPARFTAEDIRVYLAWRRGLGFSSAEYRHEIFSLGAITRFCGSSVVSQVLTKYPLLKPASSSVRLPVLSSEDLRILNGVICSVSGSFSVVRAAAEIAISLGCGGRTVELENLGIDGFDPTIGLVTFTIVKGRGTYGSPRSVELPEMYRPIVDKYLKLRSGIAKSNYFFVSERGGKLASNTMRADLSKIEILSGVHVDFRILRRSFGQGLVNLGVPIEAVSVVMGHTTTKTTEKYYARLSNDFAIQIIKEARSKNPKISESADDRRHNFTSQLLGCDCRYFSDLFSSPSSVGVDLSIINSKLIKVFSYV